MLLCPIVIHLQALELQIRSSNVRIAQVQYEHLYLTTVIRTPRKFVSPISYLNFHFHRLPHRRRQNLDSLRPQQGNLVPSISLHKSWPLKYYPLCAFSRFLLALCAFYTAYNPSLLPLHQCRMKTGCNGALEYIQDAGTCGDLE